MIAFIDNPECLKNIMHFAVFVLIILVFGFIGGLGRASLESIKDSNFKPDGTKGFIKHGILGITGAGVFVFIAILLSKYNGEKFTAADVLFFTCISTSGGVLALGIIDAFAEKVKNDWLKIKDEIDRKIQQSEVRLEKPELICAAISAIKNRSDSEMHYLISKISSIYDRFKTDRPLTIQLARLYRWTGQIDKGIGILQGYLDEYKKPEDLEGIEKIDYADILYNLACYKYIRLNEHPKEYLLNEIFKPLSDSIKMNPRNMKQMEDDSDLKEIKEEVKKHLTKNEE